MIHLQQTQSVGARVTPHNVAVGGAHVGRPVERTNSYASAEAAVFAGPWVHLQQGPKQANTTALALPPALPPLERTKKRVPLQWPRPQKGGETRQRIRQPLRRQRTDSPPRTPGSGSPPNTSKWSAATS